MLMSSPLLSSTDSVIVSFTPQNSSENTAVSFSLTCNILVFAAEPKAKAIPDINSNAIITLYTLAIFHTCDSYSAVVHARVHWRHVNPVPRCNACQFMYVLLYCRVNIRKVRGSGICVGHVAPRHVSRADISRERTVCHIRPFYVQISRAAAAVDAYTVAAAISNGRIL